MCGMYGLVGFVSWLLKELSAEAIGGGGQGQWAKLKTLEGRAVLAMVESSVGIMEQMADR